MTGQFLLVSLAGGFASVARYLFSFLDRKFPFGILLANSLASAIAGWAVSSEEYHWVIVGIAGGLSTFSTFTQQTFELWVSKAKFLALLNILLNLALPAFSFFTASYLL